MIAKAPSDPTELRDHLARRDVLRGAALLTLVLGVPAHALVANPTGVSGHQMALLRQVCKLVIPRTDTPGAGDVGVSEFVVLALDHGLLGDGQADHLVWLEHVLGANFATIGAAQQVDRLGAIDRAAFPAGPPPATPSPWRRIKGLILTGYYTSEAGASRELQYELVPGRFDPDLPLHPGDRAWSSDWTAVDFG